MSERARVKAFLVEVGSIRSPDAVVSDLDALEKLIDRWQAVQNLVSRETPGAFWTRHVLDSLQLLPMMSSSQAVLDLGSGGGFPALPLAIACKGQGTEFALVESNGRKCAYLNAVKRALDLTLRVHNQRIEAYSGPAPDLITARALAPLAVLMTLISGLAGRHTRLLLHKGREFGEELAELDSGVRANVIVHPSLTSPDAVILEWPAGSFPASKA